LTYASLPGFSPIELASLQVICLTSAGGVVFRQGCNSLNAPNHRRSSDKEWHSVRRSGGSLAYDSKALTAVGQGLLSFGIVIGDKSAD